MYNVGISTYQFIPYYASVYIQTHAHTHSHTSRGQQTDRTKSGYCHQNEDSNTKSEKDNGIP